MYGGRGVNCYDFFEINGTYAEKFVQNQLYIDNQSLSPLILSTKNWSNLSLFLTRKFMQKADFWLLQITGLRLNIFYSLNAAIGKQSNLGKGALIL